MHSDPSLHTNPCHTQNLMWGRIVMRQRSGWIKQWNWWRWWRHPGDPQSWFITPGEHSKADRAALAANSQPQISTTASGRSLDGEIKIGIEKRWATGDTTANTMRVGFLKPRGDKTYKCTSPPLLLNTIPSSVFVCVPLRLAVEWFLIRLNGREQGKTEGINFSFGAWSMIY